MCAPVESLVLGRTLSLGPPSLPLGAGIHPLAARPLVLSSADPGRFWPDTRRLLWSTADDRAFFLDTTRCQLPLSVQRIPPLPPIVRVRVVEQQTHNRRYETVY